jgi:hypothetical protein
MPNSHIPSLIDGRFLFCPIAIQRKYYQVRGCNESAWAALYLFGIRLAAWRIQ